MRVLFCINEAAPLYKLGGLGDVGGELPKALNSQGCDLRLALPFHPEIKIDRQNKITSLNIIYHAKPLSVSVYLTLLPNTGIPVYLFQESTYLDVNTGALDTNIEKSVVFSLAVAAFCDKFSSWQPHCLHLHDWHTALIPLFLKHLHHLDIPSLITIHNHRYTGSTSVSLLSKLNLPVNACQILNWDKTDNELNLLMEGVAHADAVNTVSPSYREELLKEDTPLGQILQSKSSHFFGILNGLDYANWSPQQDSFLHARYKPEDFSQGKASNKTFLQSQLGLPVQNLPLIIFVGRVDAQQKGIDLILSAINNHLFTSEKCQFVFLGTGDPHYEALLHQACSSQANIRVITRYDEALAHLLYASGDLIIIPSDYEPCGLIQLIAMRYGTIPIAHATGGLKDTIKPNHTGFLYSPNQLDPFRTAIFDALNIIKSASAQNYIKAAIDEIYDWHEASQKYLDIYHALLNL